MEGDGWWSSTTGEVFTMQNAARRVPRFRVGAVEVREVRNPPRVPRKAASGELELGSSEPIAGGSAEPSQGSEEGASGELELGSSEPIAGGSEPSQGSEEDQLNG
jgi:hypothetical protein